MYLKLESVSREVHGSLAAFLISNCSPECQCALTSTQLDEDFDTEFPNLVTILVELAVELVEIEIREVHHKITDGNHTCVGTLVSHKSQRTRDRYIPSAETSSGASSRLYEYSLFDVVLNVFP